MFILNTNVISELRHGKPNQSVEVRKWAADQLSTKLLLSAITLLELELGIQALERRTPPKVNALRAWLTGVREAFAGRILPFWGGDCTGVCVNAHSRPPLRPGRDDCSDCG